MGRVPARVLGLHGQSPAFLAELNKLPPMAQCDVTVLISGETGTGKELVARAIHYLSRRSEHPFVPVDCGAIPPELAESELFGHERGAYTGASTRTPGLIASAGQGTVFLDEVQALPLSVQAKLLRFLQEHEYRPLGSSDVRKADVRILSAANCDLREQVRRGDFREDLFYRLNVIHVHLPPLRHRTEDIVLLARHFIAKYAARFDRAVPDLSPDAVQRLLVHDWPGNVRELEHVLEAAVVLCGGGVIGVEDLRLADGRRQAEDLSFREAKARAVHDFERNYLIQMLRASGGNITAAARAAKKNRRAFWELIRKYRLDPHSVECVEHPGRPAPAARAS
jgi:two-component system response regulator GlrR